MHRIQLPTVRLATAILIAMTFTAAFAQEPVQIPGTTVQLVPPDGFTTSEGFAGFENLVTRSTITVSELPAPIDSVRQSMSESRFADRGMTLRSSEEVTVGGKPGKLMLAALDQEGVPHRKWLCIFGDAQSTVLAVATFPEITAEEMQPALKKALLSARRVDTRKGNLFDGMKFRVEETEKLKVSSRMSSTIMLTEDGRPGRGKPGDPLYVITSTPEDEPVEDLAAFAQARIRNTGGVQGITGVQGKELVIGGLRAYEAVADAKDATSGAPLKIYQVLVMRGEKFYVIQGAVDAPRAETFLAEFRKVTDSFRLTH